MLYKKTILKNFAISTETPVLKSRVRIIASHFANCKVNSYYCDRNVSHSMKNANQFFCFKINLKKIQRMNGVPVIIYMIINSF